MLGTLLRITPYAREHRTALLDLNWHSHWTHEHLDWYSTSEWIDRQLGHTLLAWHDEELLGYIGLSQPIAGWCWIRLLGIRDGRMPGALVRELWTAAESFCRDREITDVVILMVTNWLPTYFKTLGFRHDEDVITMCLEGESGPESNGSDAALRLAERADLPRLTEIDRLAFQPPWQLSGDELRQALRICSDVSVALVDGKVVAFQLGTLQEETAHVARLAVDPAYQSRQIGSMLLRRLLDDLRERPVESISVNTQGSNLTSQRLYQRFGFVRNGFDLELWRKRLD